MADYDLGRDSVRNVNVEHKESFTTLERFAVWITTHIGTMGFFLIVFLWTAFWLVWNTAGPKELHFDPFPAFALWLFISNVMQLFFLPLLMIGQNLQSRHAELRAEAEFETSRKAEKEIENILKQLEKQEKMVKNIFDAVQKDD